MIFSEWRSQIFGEKKIGLNLDPTGSNQTQNEFFSCFLEFGQLVGFEIAYNDS